MNKKIFFTFAILFVSISYANTIVNNNIKLAKHFKIENTFSGDLEENKSFHLIFSKNKKNKKYTVHSYLFDGKVIEELPILESEKSYGVVSFHKKNNVFSVLFSFKNKGKSYLKRIDYNVTTKLKEESEEYNHEDFMTSIRKKEKSILLYKRKNKIIVVNYLGNDNVEKKILDTSNKDIKKFFNKKTVTSIKTDEFVANGATNAVRLYYHNNKLIFTKDGDIKYSGQLIDLAPNNKQYNLTEIVKISLDSDSLKAIKKDFNNGSGVKFKKGTSYFFDGKLYQLGLSKKDGTINISDIETGKSINTISLNNSLTKSIKGNDNFEGITKFLKNAGKKKYNATITANKTKNNKIRLRIDYVDASYSYNYNWWWHHQQFMWHMQQHQNFMHQNMMRSIPSGFGPRQPDEYSFETATVKKEKRFFELLIDQNGSISDDELTETVYKEIDKKSYINTLEEIEDLKNESSCFLKNSFRYIGYSRGLKCFIIQTNKIK